MRRPIFIDTGYILALVNTADEYHASAVAASTAVQPPFITTEAVLIEIGNALSKVRWRALGFATIQDLRTDPDITVVSVDTSLLDRAVTLYGARLDKEWSLTDCISFVVIQERGLIQALTTDHHFGQVGIENLLPEPD